MLTGGDYGFRVVCWSLMGSEVGAQLQTVTPLSQNLSVAGSSSVRPPDPSRFLTYLLSVISIPEDLPFPNVLLAHLHLCITLS